MSLKRVFAFTQNCNNGVNRISSSAGTRMNLTFEYGRRNRPSLTARTPGICFKDEVKCGIPDCSDSGQDTFVSFEIVFIRFKCVAVRDAPSVPPRRRRTQKVGKSRL